MSLNVSYCKRCKNPFDQNTSKELCPECRNPRIFKNKGWVKGGRGDGQI